MPYRTWRKLAPPLLAISFALCVAVLALGEPVNGARRWLTLGPAVFQPSELAKLAIAVWAAAYLARRRAPSSLGELAKPLGAVAAVFCGLILLEPDLGTTVCIFVILGALLLVSGTPLRVLGAAAGVAGAAAAVAIAIEPYRQERLFAFLDPWKDPQDTGFQSVQALIGIGSGGFFGKGLGQGVQKFDFLPEAHTDMIFAVIAEELGLVGSTLLIAAYGAFAYAGLRVAMRATDPFAKRLAAGLTALVCGQAVVNLGAVLALVPLTGIPLPFVSAGGSSLVVALTAVGVLLNIASGGGRRVAPMPDRGRRDGRSRPARARGGGRAPGARRRGHVRGNARPRRDATRS
jgi:cell division protein FtsW